MAPNGKEWVFLAGNFAFERTTTTTAIKTSLHVPLRTRKFYRKIVIVAGDVPQRAVFNVRTLAVLFPPYPRKM